MICVRSVNFFRWIMILVAQLLAILLCCIFTFLILELLGAPRPSFLVPRFARRLSIISASDNLLIRMLQVRSPRNLKLALMKSGEGEQQIENAKNVVYRVSLLTYKKTAYDWKKVFFFIQLQSYNFTIMCSSLTCQ